MRHDDDVDVFVEVAGELCEGPCWDEKGQSLVWVDILAGRVHSADPSSGAHEARRVSKVVSAVAPRRSGGWVAALERGFALFDGDWSLQGPFIGVPGQPEGTRFNDGRCDQSGRFWAGTIAYDGTPNIASLYRFDPDGSVAEILTGVTNSNGLSWSRDGKTMYYVDTGCGTVDMLAFDPASGTASDRRTLVTVPPDEGLPDGLTIDGEGYLWLALWGGGCVRRYSPDGRLDRIVNVPATQVTSMTFGGADLDDLFITTAREGLSPGDLESQPLAGSVFRHRPGVSGLPPNTFFG